MWGCPSHHAGSCTCTLLASMTQGPGSALALEHVPCAPAFYSKHLCISPYLSFGQMMMLLRILGGLSPLYLARCQVWVMGRGALTRHCLASRRAAGHSLSTVASCSSHDPFLLAVSPRCPTAAVLSFLPYFTQSSAPGKSQLSYFPPPQVCFLPASQCSHAGHSSAALGPARLPRLWERPDVSHGTMPRSTSPRKLRYQQGVKSFLKISRRVAS